MTVRLKHKLCTHNKQDFCTLKMEKRILGQLLTELIRESGRLHCEMGQKELKTILGVKRTALPNTIIMVPSEF